MNARTANYWLIRDAFGFLEVAEASKGEPLNLDPDDEQIAKRAFALYIKPEVEKWSPERIAQLKISFAYFIHRIDILEDRVLANIPDLTMPEPSNIQRLFFWLWECLFPGEGIETIDIDGVEEINDVLRTNPEGM